MNVFLALSRAFRSLFRKKVFWHLLWPSLVSIVLWTLVGYFTWDWLTSGLFGWIQKWPWVGGWIAGSDVAAGTAKVLVNLAVFAGFLPLAYITASIIVGSVALPLILEHVASTEYPDVEQRHGGTNTGSILNTLSAGTRFVVMLVVSLPLWLIPGIGLIVPMLLAAWFNQRTLAYDALTLHADREEIRSLPKTLRAPLMTLSASCSLLAYIPLVNLLAPALTGLAFVHFLLGNLRKLRAGAALDS